jgi:hypothetical protein
MASAVWASSDAQKRPAMDHPVSIAEVIRLVEERGWRVNLGPICAAFDLPLSSGECVFKQISVSETEGRGDPRGFNVPVETPPGDPYVLVFHLGPLVGEFFVVRPDGELIRAFYRAKGTGYRPLPNEDVSDEFKIDIRYWLDNFSRLKSTVQR